MVMTRLYFTCHKLFSSSSRSVFLHQLMSLQYFPSIWICAKIISAPKRLLTKCHYDLFFFISFLFNFDKCYLKNEWVGKRGKNKQRNYCGDFIINTMLLLLFSCFILYSIIVRTETKSNFTKIFVLLFSFFFLLMLV